VVQKNLIIYGGEMKRSLVITVRLVMGLCVLLVGCARATQSTSSQGTSWGMGVFTSNGEQIYFTSTSDRGTDITYTAGPSSNNWMMMGGQLACASCHGPDGKGGEHTMGMMQVMNAPDIRWKTLETDYNAETSKRAVEQDLDEEGQPLSQDMPRWKMSDGDISDLIAFLKTLP
jgi:cytochrome c oxidase subunit 2